MEKYKIGKGIILGENIILGDGVVIWNYIVIGKTPRLEMGLAWVVSATLEEFFVNWRGKGSYWKNFIGQKRGWKKSKETT